MEATSYQLKLENALIHEMLNLREKIDNLDPENMIIRAIYKAQIFSYDRILKGIAD